MPHPTLCVFSPVPLFSSPRNPAPDHLTNHCPPLHLTPPAGPKQAWKSVTPFGAQKLPAQSPWQIVKALQSLTSSRLANLTFHSPLPPPGQSHPLVPPEPPSDQGRTEPASPSGDSVSASLRAEVIGIHQTPRLCRC